MEEDPLIPQRMRDISRTQGNIIVFFFYLQSVFKGIGPVRTNLRESTVQKCGFEFI